MTQLSAYVRGIGLLGPGLDDWASAASVLAGIAPYTPRATVLPPPAALPPAERRRTGAVVRLALAIGFEAISRAGVAASELPTIFSSSGGDGANCHEICVTLASGDRQLSPTRFHNSVHNAASGYWSIAARRDARVERVVCIRCQLRRRSAGGFDAGGCGPDAGPVCRV